MSDEGVSDEAIQAIADLIEPNVVKTISVEGVHELAEDILEAAAPFIRAPLEAENERLRQERDVVLREIEGDAYQDDDDPAIAARVLRERSERLFREVQRRGFERDEARADVERLRQALQEVARAISDARKTRVAQETSGTAQTP